LRVEKAAAIDDADPMEPFHLAHLILLSMWGGVVLAETVIEAAGVDEASLRAAARLHYRIDVFVEVPLLGAVLATGAVLTSRAWPPVPLLAAKIAAGLVVIGINLWCVGVVVARHRRLDDAAALVKLSRHVRLAGLGTPLAVFAAILGLMYFRG
jgi:hypothetical protein